MRDPAARVAVDRIAISVDGRRCQPTKWRTVLLHKPRGVVTTRTDPLGRPTVYDVLGEAGAGLKPVGRLDWATSGLLVLTSDADLGHWIADPAHQVAEVYAVTVRGRVEESALASLRAGIRVSGERLLASGVAIRKSSARETHLIVELREGRNREVRRIFDSLGHEVTRLKRVAFGGLTLGDLAPGRWRELKRWEVAQAFPAMTLHGS